MDIAAILTMVYPQLDETAISRFDAYLQLLVHSAAEFNLVADPSPAEIVSRHFVDSLHLLNSSEVFHVKHLTLVDVGSGAGLPGLPLKIARADIKLTLLDATGKKCNFLRNVVETLGLQQVEVLNARAEEAAHLPAFRERFDVATARGVTAMSPLAELCLPFVKVGGQLLAMKSRRAVEETTKASVAIATLGGQLLKGYDYTLAASEPIAMQVVRVKKVAVTPPRYPRMWGKIKKNPL